jgi:pyruvate-formate lyase-activating enzyme
MSIEQITKFVQESLQLNWKWKKITLIGGEPTLHPYFFEVLSIVKKYKDKHNHCEIIVATNGYGPIVNQVLTKIPVWVTIINSKKQ